MAFRIAKYKRRRLKSNLKKTCFKFLGELVNICVAVCYPSCLCCRCQFCHKKPRFLPRILYISVCSLKLSVCSVQHFQRSNNHRLLKGDWHFLKTTYPLISLKFCLMIFVNRNFCIWFNHSSRVAS